MFHHHVTLHHACFLDDHCSLVHFPFFQMIMPPHADSVHGSIEQKITDFPSGFEGQWVARMGVPMNTVRCSGLSPTFAASGAHDPPDSVLKGLVQPLFQKNGLF